MQSNNWNFVKCSSVVALMCVAVLHATGQDVIHGTITDATTRQPIGGASIRIVGTTRGTYTRANGTYRLPLTQGAERLNVRSIGYKEKTVQLSGAEEISVSLDQAPIQSRVVGVVADISPEELVHRAIERKEENSKRITSLISTLYSKMKVAVDGTGLSPRAGSTEVITESFSKVYDQRVPTKQSRVHILQRRQTKNVLPTENLAVFDQFFDFTTDEINILETRLVTPLSRDALDEYKYEITGKKLLGDKMVYELKFEPKARMYPGFEGVLTIVEGSYQVIAARFSPTDETAFPFLKGLSYEQRYERTNDTLWVPMYQQASAKASVNVITGLLSIDVNVSAETFVTDVQANVPIPDSLLNPPEDTTKVSRLTTTRGDVSVSVRQRGRVTTVEKDADSIRPEFWEKHSFADLTEEEKQAYHKADSIALTDTTSGEDGDVQTQLGLFNIGGVGINIAPILDRSYITGMMFGADIIASYEPLKLTFGGTFGQEATKTGHVELDARLISSRSFSLDIHGGLFSRLSTIQSKRSLIGRNDLLNLSHVVYSDNHDFFFEDGWDAGIDVRYGRLEVSIQATNSRHINKPVIATLNRLPIRAEPGNFQTLSLQVGYGRPTIGELFVGSSLPVDGSITFTYGQEVASGLKFGSIEAQMGIRVPTFATGYKPMVLELRLTGGMSVTDSLPIQNQFGLMRRFNVLGKLSDLSTVNINAYGGTLIGLAIAEHNFTDLWWRAIGLPTLPNKRGVDLIAVFGAATVEDRFPSSSQPMWNPTSDVYMEAGFAISRIPTFLSDLFYLRFDAMWPVGLPAVQNGSVGWTISVTSPLF